MSKDLLRATRMVREMHLPTTVPMVSLLAKNVYGLKDAEHRHAREHLEKLLWLSRGEDRSYSCYDIQFEAV